MADRRQRFAVLKNEGELHIYVRGSLPAEKISAGSTITFEVIENDDKLICSTIFSMKSRQKRKWRWAVLQANWWDDEPEMPIL